MLKVSDFDDAKQDLDFIDEVRVTSLDLLDSRLGNEFKTRIGTLKGNGYQEAAEGGLWASGVVFNSYKKYLLFDAKIYVPKTSTGLPVTTGAEPDENFEVFTSIVNADLSSTVDDYNKYGLGDFTSYVFKGVTDLVNLINNSGSIIDLTIGNIARVSDNLGFTGIYKITDDTEIGPGTSYISLSNGLYAVELYASKNPEFGNPFKDLNFNNDAMNFKKPNLTKMDVPSGMSGTASKSCLGADGRIYINHSAANKIYAFDSFSGFVREYTTVQNANLTGPVLGPDSCIYFLASTYVPYYVYKLNTVTGVFTGLISRADNPSSNYPVNNSSSLMLSDNGLFYILGYNFNTFKIISFNPLDPVPLFNKFEYGSDDGFDYRINKDLAHCLAPNGVIYMASPEGSLMSFNPKTDEFKQVFNARTEGVRPGLSSRYFNSIAVGPDGLIYMTTNAYNDQNGFIYQLNPQTDEIDESFMFVEGNGGYNAQLKFLTFAENGLGYVTSDKIYGVPIVEIDVINKKYSKIENSKKSGFDVSANPSSVCIDKYGTIVCPAVNSAGYTITNVTGKQNWVKSAYVARG